MSEHTPGPWHTGKEMERGLDLRKNIYNSKGEFIAAVVSSAGLRSEHENRANARLIAAAPDLLAACEMARDAFRILSTSFVYDPEFTELERVLNAAIANAKGETE
jgi:hypothetical protein